MEKLKQQKSSKTKALKPFLFIMLLMISISCKKVKQAAERITIIGTVSDTENLPLDSVEITLDETCFMCMGAVPIETTHSELGTFIIDFKPRQRQSYHVDFRKRGYRDGYYPVDLYKEIQYCTMVMKKAEN